MQNFETIIFSVGKIPKKILGGIFDKHDIESKLRSLKKLLEEDFWKDKLFAKRVVKQKIFEDLLKSFNNFSNEISNLKELYNLASQENDEIIEDCLSKSQSIYQAIKKSEISCFLSGDDDDLDIYLEIHAGAGGTESQDWADMLRRMYLKWFDKKF